MVEYIAFAEEETEEVDSARSTLASDEAKYSNVRCT